MHVRAVVPYYPPHSLVGSWITTHEFLRHLVSRGHAVDVVAYHAIGGRVVHDGVTVATRFRDSLSVRPDVVVGHAGDDGSSRVVADRHRCPLVLMVHGGDDAHVRAQVRSATLAVFNAHSYRDAIPHQCPSIVCHPPVNAADYATTRGEHVTLVNLSEAKGGPLLWKLSDELPGLSFLAVRGSYGDQVMWSGHSNVTLQRPTPLMREAVYRRTRVLLMPSERETFGRVALEAAASGIPTIAHPCAGIVEAMGEGATYCDRDDAGAWVAQLEALSEPTAYAEASAAALAVSQGFDRGEQLSRFEAALLGLCDG